MFQHLSPDVQQAIDHLLTVPEGEQRSYFYRLKEYPPAATISSLQAYLQRYHTISATGITEVAPHGLTPGLSGVPLQAGQTLQRHRPQTVCRHKRYELMLRVSAGNPQSLIGSSSEDARSIPARPLPVTRKTPTSEQRRELRKRQKKAINIVLDTTSLFLEWPDELPLSKTAVLATGR